MSWASTSETTAEVIGALVAALNEVPAVGRSQTANTGTYSYRYADLADVLGAVRSAFAAHDLAVSQTAWTDTDTRQVCITTTVMHASGQWLTYPPLAFPLGNNPQVTGSAITYARRYALMAVAGIAPEDDDGALAARAAETRQAPRPTVHRTEAEAEARRLLGALQPGPRNQVIEAFKDEFGCGLSQLPPDRHDEALSFLEYLVTPDGPLQREGEVEA